MTLGTLDSTWQTRAPKLPGIFQPGGSLVSAASGWISLGLPGGDHPNRELAPSGVKALVAVIYHLGPQARDLWGLPVPPTDPGEPLRFISSWSPHRSLPQAWPFPEAGPRGLFIPKIHGAVARAVASRGSSHPLSFLTQGIAWREPPPPKHWLPLLTCISTQPTTAPSL